MAPEEAVQAHGDVRGAALLPVHWGTFNLAFHAWDEPIGARLAGRQPASISSRRASARS